MPTRLPGALLLLVVLLFGVLGGPAAGVEEPEEGAHQDLPSIDEIGTGTEVSEQFRPEEAERQPFSEALIFPLMAVGLLAVLVIGALYLKWQPEFGREESRRR